MTDRSKFQETQLPSIENFYNILKDEPLSTEDYERAQNTRKFFGIQNLQQYHDIISFPTSFSSVTYFKISDGR